MMPNPSRPLTVKELAAALGVSRGFVWAMRKMGFPERRATFDEAVAWLRERPAFRVRQAWGATA